MQRQLLSLVVVASAFSLATCGCGPSDRSVKVTGSVTMGSQPQDGTRISFIPTGTKDDVPPQGAAAGPDGKFEAKLIPGKYKVILSRLVDKSGKVPGESEDPSQDFTQLRESGLLSEVIPQKYTSPDATPLAVDIPAEGKDLEPFVVEK